MSSCHCCTTDRQFDARTARRDLRRFLRRGPDPATRQLLSTIEAAPLPTQATLLDIGGGIGVIHHRLLDHGFASAVHVDASAGYLAVATAEAARRGHADRVSFRHADFRSAAAEVPSADVVTLDRVVCCDPDYPGLLGAAAERTRRLLGFTYPRDRWYTRAAVRGSNAWRRWWGQAFQVYVHDPAGMAALLEQHGLRRRWSGGTWIWAAEVYERC